MAASRPPRAHLPRSLCSVSFSQLLLTLLSLAAGETSRGTEETNTSEIFSFLQLTRVLHVDITDSVTTRPSHLHVADAAALDPSLLRRTSMAARVELLNGGGACKSGCPTLPLGGERKGDRLSGRPLLPSPVRTADLTSQLFPSGECILLGPLLHGGAGDVSLVPTATLVTGPADLAVHPSSSVASSSSSELAGRHMDGGAEGLQAQQWQESDDASADGDYERALELYKNAIETGPVTPLLYTFRATALINLQKYDEAIIDADRAINLDPTNQKAHYLKGLALLKLKQYQAAKATLLGSPYLDPECADLLKKCKKHIAGLYRSEKAVADVSESASALTLQETGVSSPEVLIDTKSLEESFTATPPEAPHNTIGNSSSTLPSSCERLLIDVSDSASTPALKELDVSLYELLGISSEECIIAGPMLPFKTIDVSSSCEQKTLAGAGKSICAPSLQYPVVSSSDEFSDNSSIESISAGPWTVPHNTNDGSQQSPTSIGSIILTQHYMNCYHGFYIRMDRRGLFLTYPNVGGPFHSEDEAKRATKCFFDELRCERCKEDDEFSHVEGVVHDRKFYLRGPPKRASSQSTYDEKWYLIKCLLDQYNEENNLVGNCAHELDDLLRKQIIYENSRWHYHFNFTTKQKGDDDNPSNAKKLFFAEVAHMPERKAWEVTCCCIIDPQPNGVPSVHDDVACYGCTNNGSPYMMHPSNTGAFVGGRWNGYLPFDEEASDSDDQDENVIDMYDLDDDDDDDDDDEEEEEEEEDVAGMVKLVRSYVQPTGGP